MRNLSNTFDVFQSERKNNTNYEKSILYIYVSVKNMTLYWRCVRNLCNKTLVTLYSSFFSLKKENMLLLLNVKESVILRKTVTKSNGILNILKVRNFIFSFPQHFTFIFKFMLSFLVFLLLCFIISILSHILLFTFNISVF